MAVITISPRAPLTRQSDCSIYILTFKIMNAELTIRCDCSEPNQIDLFVTLMTRS